MLCYLALGLWKSRLLLHHRQHMVAMHNQEMEAMKADVEKMKWRDAQKVK